MPKTNSTETLDSELMQEVQSLIRVNLDSMKGFDEAAAKIEQADIAALFRDVARERSGNAAELQTYVRAAGEDAADAGTYAGAMHRAWMDLQSLVMGGDAYSILAEAERGEDYIKNAYEKAMKFTDDNDLSRVFQRQYAQVKSSHDRVRDLRDTFARDNCKECD